MHNMLSDEDRAYLDVILGCEPELNRWRLRVQRVEQPEPGSELMGDDRSNDQNLWMVLGPVT